LIASSKTIVGRMKSQAIDRSDKPRMRLEIGAAARLAKLSTSVGVTFVPFISSAHGIIGSLPQPPGGGRGRDWAFASELRRILAFLLEDFDPVLEQRVERRFRCALVGDNVVVDPILHVEQKRDIERLRPKVLHDSHRFDE
jgi:hypothetical protein